jgi:hypothetical protein
MEGERTCNREPVSSALEDAIEDKESPEYLRRMTSLANIPLLIGLVFMMFGGEYLQSSPLPPQPHRAKPSFAPRAAMP